MKPFLIDKLKRNGSKVKSCLKNIGDSSMVTSKITVLFPSRYVDKKLAIMGDTVLVLGVIVIIDDNNNYAVMNAPVMIELSPSMSGEVSINDVTYTSLGFAKDDIFIGNVNVVKRDGFVFDLFDEFFIHGNIPWFLNYEDVSNLLMLSNKYAGTDIGDNPLGLELVTSIVARLTSSSRTFVTMQYDQFWLQPSDTLIQARLCPKNSAILPEQPFSCCPLNSSGNLVRKILPISSLCSFPMIKSTPSIPEINSG